MLLECRKVLKTFRVGGGAVTPLQSVSFSLRAGEIAVIAGRSGAGKSVLISLIAGLDRPDAGEILFHGHPDDSPSAVRSRRIGVLFQNHNLVSSWTALENVEAALVPGPLSRSESRCRAGRILSRLGLDKRTGHLPHQMSMGEQQRVAIARMMVLEPLLILADEPTGDVDAVTGGEIIRLLGEAVREWNAGLLVTTHGNFPLDAADTAYQLEEGRLGMMGRSGLRRPGTGERKMRLYTKRRAGSSRR
jgi:putative ABC transport system ATP-binding protein